jgi:hypothetical protein
VAPHIQQQQEQLQQQLPLAPHIQQLQQQLQQQLLVAPHIQQQQEQLQQQLPLAPHIQLPMARYDQPQVQGSCPGLAQVDFNALSYDIMFRFCATQLSLGLSVIVDCPLAHKKLFDQGKLLAKEVGRVHRGQDL